MILVSPIFIGTGIWQLATIPTVPRIFIDILLPSLLILMWIANLTVIFIQMNVKLKWFKKHSDYIISAVCGECPKANQCDNNYVCVRSVDDHDLLMAQLHLAIITTEKDMLGDSKDDSSDNNQ